MLMHVNLLNITHKHLTLGPKQEANPGLWKERAVYDPFNQHNQSPRRLF